MGIHLKDGARRKQKLLHTARGLGDPIAKKLTAKNFLEYRFIRSEQGASEQIETLLTTIKSFSENPHVLLLSKICLSTGACWGEAEGITLSKVVNQKITFSKTKSGKVRAIPISEKLSNELVEHLEEFGAFSSSIGAFRRALSRSGISLLKGQATHVLRHTFASHFMMNGGDILTLQRILGYSTINMTMRYAHLSKDHLSEAVTLNPISKGD